MVNIVPFETRIYQLSGPAQPLVPGAIQSVLFTVEAENLEPIHQKMLDWFGDRPDVVLVDHGTTDKRGDGFIVLDWIGGYAVDPLFLSILESEPFVLDYTVYTSLGED